MPPTMLTNTPKRANPNQPPSRIQEGRPRGVHDNLGLLYGGRFHSAPRGYRLRRFWVGIGKRRVASWSLLGFAPECPRTARRGPGVRTGMFKVCTVIYTGYALCDIQAPWDTCRAVPLALMPTQTCRSVSKHCSWW